MSLKYRIAVVIFVLEALMMALVLSQTLSFSLRSTSDLLKANERLIQDLMAEVSLVGLVTEEFHDLNLSLQRYPLPASVLAVVVSNEVDMIVAATEPSLVGERLGTLPSSKDANWQTSVIDEQGAGFQGKLAIRYSQDALIKSAGLAP